MGAEGWWQLPWMFFGGLPAAIVGLLMFVWQLLNVVAPGKRAVAGAVLASSSLVSLAWAVHLKPSGYNDPAFALGLCFFALFPVVGAGAAVVAKLAGWAHRALA